MSDAGIPPVPARRRAVRVAPGQGQECHPEEARRAEGGQGHPLGESCHEGREGLGEAGAPVLRGCRTRAPQGSPCVGRRVSKTARSCPHGRAASGTDGNVETRASGKVLRKDPQAPGPPGSLPFKLVLREASRLQALPSSSTPLPDPGSSGGSTPTKRPLLPPILLGPV